MSGQDQNSQSILNLNFSQLFTGKHAWLKATIMIVSILLAAGFAAEKGANVSVNMNLDARVSAIETTMAIPINSSLSAFRKTNSYIISLVDTYACFQRGNNGSSPEWSTNHTLIVQDALNNASVSGGSVYVAEGSYSASVTLKNNTRLIIETGATGITVAGVDASATCLLDDFNSWYFKYYSNGSLYSQFDYKNGNLLVASANITTVYVKTIDSIDATSVKILKLAVENGTNFPTSPVAARLFYRDDLFTLYFWNSTNWVSCAGGGGSGSDDDSLYLLSASASNFLFQNGARALTADWALGNFGIYQATWVNATSLNFSGQLWWNGVNRTDAIANPFSDFRYMVIASGSTYQLKNGTDGQIPYSSPDSSAVISAAFGNLTTGRYWKETVELKGQINLSSSISIPSYSKLIILDKLFLTNNANTSMIVNANPTTGNTQIEISGGELDGNQANEQAQSGCPIWIYNTTFLKVHDTVIHDSAFYGIRLAPPGAINDPFMTYEVFSNQFYNNRNDHMILGAAGTITKNIMKDKVIYNYISLVNASGVSITENLLLNNSAGQYGIAFEYASFDNTVAHNTIINCNCGIDIYASTGGYWNTISDNIIIGEARDYYGIAVESGGNNTIANNVIDGFTNTTKGYGIWLYQTSGNDVHDNKFKNTRFGIVLNAADTSNQIHDNDFTNTTSIFSNGGNYTLRNNQGINPIGYISSPIVGSTSEVAKYGGNNATWVSAKVYFANGEVKDIYYNTTEVTAVTLNTRSMPITGILHVEPTWTLSFTFSNVTYANIQVFGY